MADTLNNDFFNKGLPRYIEENGSKLPESLQSFDGGSILILNEDQRIDTLLSLFVVLQLMVNRHPLSERYYDELCLNEHGSSCHLKVFEQLKMAQEKMNTLSEPRYTTNNRLRSKRSPARPKFKKPSGVKRPSPADKNWLKSYGITGVGKTRGHQKIYHEINTSDKVPKTKLWDKLIPTHIKQLPCGIKGCNRQGEVLAHFLFSHKLKDPYRESCLGQTCKHHNDRRGNDKRGQNSKNYQAPASGKGKGQWNLAKPKDAQEYNGHVIILDKVIADAKTGSTVISRKGTGKGSGGHGDGFTIRKGDLKKDFKVSRTILDWAPLGSLR